MRTYKKKTRELDKRAKKVIVFDTETAPIVAPVDKPYKVNRLKYKPRLSDCVPNSIKSYEFNGVTYWECEKINKEVQIIFDIGWTVCDRHGNIFKKYNSLVEESFFDSKIMSRAFYFNKYPDYLRMMNENKVKAKVWREIVRDLEDDIEEFNVSEVYAYNIAFDLQAINDTNAILSKKGFTLWKDYSIKTNCLWGMACETLLQQKTFKKLAAKLSWFTPTKNFSSNAEVCYKYITGDFEFQESHTALDDAVIETEILARCFRTKRKMSFGIISNPWRLVGKE